MIGTIDVKTRPLKIAYLVDPNSARQTREAIQTSSTLWGGDYFPIIPTYKRMPSTWRERSTKTPSAKSVILGYIEAFDPDILVQFSRDVPKFITDVGLRIVKPDEIWQLGDEDRNLAPKYGLGIFEILNDLFEQNFKFKKKYPIEIIFPKIPKEFSLFWVSLFGEIPQKVVPQLEKYYFEPLEIKTPTFKIENIKQLMAGKVLFPRRITHHEINNHSRSGFGKNAYVYYLDATKIEDIIDFWNLRAMGKKVMPIPKQLQDNPYLKEIVVNFLKAQCRPYRHNPKICDFASIIRARNCKMEELQEYAKTLKIDYDLPNTPNEPFFALQHWYPRVWDEWARDKDEAVPDDIYGSEEDSVEIMDTKDFRIRFKSLLPKFAQKYNYHIEPRCANEVSFSSYVFDEYIAEVFPKSSGKNFVRAISGLTSHRGDWRVGRNGLVKLVRDSFNETRYIPLSEKVLFAWLEDLGWKVKLSSAGLLAKQIHKKLNGFLPILTNEKLLGLLEHMNGGSVNQDCSPIRDNKINQERYLLVGEVKNRLRDASGKSDFHDNLVELGIFKMGSSVQCPHCLRNSWFALEDIRDIFTCPRCLNTFSAIGHLNGSNWCYKTAGPFSVPNYADGAYAVLLAIDFFNELKMTTMRITPALSFAAEIPDKKSIEADFAAFWQESIYGESHDGLLFGECKTYGVFTKKDFDKMLYLAKVFPGAILVFSTLRKSLTAKEIASITSITKVGRKYWKAERPINPVLILTGNELLGQSGPPYCWEETIKKKFEHIRGIIEVCDATQQIYLNLPSWQTEWMEKWEKRRQQRKLEKIQSEDYNDE